MPKPEVPSVPSLPALESLPQPAPRSQGPGEQLGTSTGTLAPRLEISTTGNRTAREVRLVLEEPPSTPPGSGTGDDLEVALLTPVSMDTVFAPSVPRCEAHSSAALGGGWPRPGIGKDGGATPGASASPDRRRRRCRTLSSTALEGTPTPSRGGGERRFRAHEMALRTPDSMVTERLTPTSFSSEEAAPDSQWQLKNMKEEEITPL